MRGTVLAVILLATARELGGRLSHLLERAGAERVEIVGETRRGCAQVSEIRLLASGLSRREACAALRAAAAAGVLDVKPLRDGARARLVDGDTIRVRTVRPVDWVRAQLQETSDKAHFEWLGRCARRKGLRFAEITENARDDRHVYRALGLRCVPPELREGAAPVMPPDLVTVDDVAGIFHVHTDWSDGSHPIVAMARAADAAGFTYIGISDHSKAAVYARGLDERRLREQAAAIAIARREVPEVTILH